MAARKGPDSTWTVEGRRMALALSRAGMSDRNVALAVNTLTESTVSPNAIRYMRRIKRIKSGTHHSVQPQNLRRAG